MLNNQEPKLNTIAAEEREENVKDKIKSAIQWVVNSLLGGAVVLALLCSVPANAQQQMQGPIYPGDWTNFTATVAAADTNAAPTTLLSSVGDVVGLVISNSTGNSGGLRIAFGTSASTRQSNTNAAQMTSNVIFLADKGLLSYGIGTANPYIPPGPIISKTDSNGGLGTASITVIYRGRLQ